MRRQATVLLILISMTALGAGCSDSSGPEGRGQVTLNLATRPALAAPGMAALVSDTLSDGTNQLVIDQVELVVREIELERVNDDACDDVAGANDDDCEELEFGPILLDLPLGPGVDRTFTVAVDTGTFDEIELDIHKPEDSGDQADRDFIAANPAFSDVSIRVTGTYNGQPYVYTSDLNVEQELELAPPLVIQAVSTVDITIFIDLGRWFVDGSGQLIDPATANKGGAFESVVEDNIKQSIEAFEDDDRDGQDD